jgi:hypothetical protein
MEPSASDPDSLLDSMNARGDPAMGQLGLMKHCEQRGPLGPPRSGASQTLTMTLRGMGGRIFGAAME